MVEKSEAQIRNEEAVRRIMTERGYDRTSVKKEQTNETFGKNFAIAPFIVAFIAAGGIIGGWLLLKDNPFEAKHYNSSDRTSAELNQERANFKACLGSIDNSEITIDDADFWNKHISRYEQTISCYDKYPSVSSLATKVDLQDKLTELRKKSEISVAQDAERKANLDRINAEHEANMAKIDKELAENLAKIQKESEEQSQELTRRMQEREEQRATLDAEYDRSQREQEQRAAAEEYRRQQQEQAARARCNEYLSTYGERTAEEIAESDSEVKNAKYNWIKSQGKVRSALSCTGGNVVYTQSQREQCNYYRNQELQTAESYRSEYARLLQQKTAYYKNLKIASCGR